MLQHHCHLLRIFFLKPRRNAYTGRSSKERDEEVMIARQASRCHFRKNLANDATEGFLSENIVTDEILNHRLLIPRIRRLMSSLFSDESKIFQEKSEAWEVRKCLRARTKGHQKCPNTIDRTFLDDGIINSLTS